MYHAISPKYDDFKLIMKNWRAKNAIVETVEKCLKKAEKHKLSNIAIPAISSGECSGVGPEFGNGGGGGPS